MIKSWTFREFIWIGAVSLSDRIADFLLEITSLCWFCHKDLSLLRRSGLILYAPFGPWRDWNQSFAPSWEIRYRYRWAVFASLYVCAGYVGGVPVLLAKPQTYMNLSGESVSPSVSLLLFTIQYISSSNLDTPNPELYPFVCFCTGE